MNIDHITTNLFRIFGSWLLIQGIYYIARSTTKQAIDLNLKEKFFVYVNQLGAVFVVLGFFLGGAVLVLRIHTWEFFIEALVVCVVPALVGIHNGLIGPDLPERP